MPVEHINPTDSLNTGRVKLNAAIDQSNEAITKATSAETTANQAKNTADNVQAQFNQVVIEGDSSVEAAQARVSYTGTTYQTLKERLDTEHESVTTQLAQITNNTVYVSGATGDVDKDSTNIQDAFNAIKNGGELIIDEGDYMIDSRVTGITLTERDVYIRIRGRGKANLILVDDTHAIHIRSLLQGVYRGFINISGIWIDGELVGSNYDAPNAKRGIYLDSVQWCDISENTINGFYGTGISVLRVELPSRVAKNRLLNVWGLNPTMDSNGEHDNYGDGVYVAYANNFSVEENVIINDLHSTNNYGRAGIVLEFGTEKCRVDKNIIHGYDRNIHIEESNGLHVITQNTLTGSSIGILTSGNNAPSEITHNIINNHGALSGLRNIIGPRAPIYIYKPRESEHGYKIKENIIQIYDNYHLPNYIFYSGSDKMEVTNNKFIGDKTRLHFYVYNRKNNTFKDNEMKKVNAIELGTGTGNLFEDNDMDIVDITGPSPKPGNTFINNKIYNSDGLLKRIIPYNAYNNFIGNEVSNWERALIVNDGVNSGGEISDNTFKRTVSTSATKIFEYFIGNKPYHSRKPNTFIDTINGTTDSIRPYGEIFLEDGRRIVDVDSVPTSGTWYKGDKARNINPTASEPTEYWLRVTDGNSNILGTDWIAK